jgi:hypothetical protein
VAGLVSFGFLCAAVASAVLPPEFADERSVGLDFEVVDGDSRRPVPGAFLRISNPFDPDWRAPKALTNPDGRARLTGRFPAAGERNLFRSMGTFSPWGRWLEETAVHHRTMRLALPRVVGPNDELDVRRVHTVVVTQGAALATAFRDIAGAYVIPSDGFGGSELSIEPDGRFVWSRITHSTPEFQEYGYLIRDGLEIEPVPIPHPGVPANFFTGSRFRVIAWGDRTYLAGVEDGDLCNFCRATLTPGRGADPRDPMGGYICVPRLFDSTKRPIGLPRLPLTAWATFGLHALSGPHEDGELWPKLQSFLDRHR